MAYPSLKEFLADLDRSGQLIRIKERVSPILEITEITDRVSKSKDGGKALLFENVEDSEVPLLINAFGNWKRLHMAMGVKHVDEIAARIADLIVMTPPRDFFGKIDFFRNLFHVKDIPPKIVKNGLCQEIIYTGDDIDLFRFPILKCWPQDGGRFITMPVVYTESLKTGKRNAGMYRLQVYDKKTTGMHWHIHKDGSHYFQEYKKANNIMEVAVAIGTDPVVTFAATTPLPRHADEMLLAGFIRKQRVEMVKCKTIDLEVPATAEIVLEGYINPDETRIEGPFGDHTGYYSLEDSFPVFHLTAITTRKNPVYLTTIVGKPPMEDCYLGKATERIFLPMLKTQIPELVNMNLPWEGVFHNCVVASIDKLYPLQSRKVMSAMWGLGQLSFAKMIALTDPEIVLSDTGDVVREILNKTNITKDIFVTEGILDVLDHSSPTPLFGGKMGIDATTKIKGEPGFSNHEDLSYPEINPDQLLSALKSAINGVISLAVPLKYVKNPLVILGLQKKETMALQTVFEKVEQEESAKDVKIFLIIDGHLDAHDYSVAAWKFFNNCDPRRDFYFRKGRLFLDATKKRREEGHDRKWPDDIQMDQDILRLVSEKWKHYGITLE